MKLTHYLPDLVLCIHLLWVAFIVISVPLIILGGKLDWRWVRNRWYRLIHIVMMLIVAAEAVLGIVCPLTTWEHSLRMQAGEPGYRQGLIADFVGRLLFYDFEPIVFTVGYLLFLALILLLCRLVPPERK